MHEHLATLRAEIDAADLVGGALVLATLYVLTDFDETAIVTLAAVLVGTPLAGAAFEALGVSRTAAGVAFGAVVAAAGGLVALDAAVLGGVVVAVGAWIALDAVYTWRTGGRSGSRGDELGEPARRQRRERGADGDPLDEDASFGETNRVLQDSGAIVRTLRDAPVALPESDLADRTDLPDERFDAALRMALDSAAVEETTRGYVAKESELGLRASLRRLLRRIVRPFRLFVPG